MYIIAIFLVILGNFYLQGLIGIISFILFMFFYSTFFYLIKIIFSNIFFILKNFKSFKKIILEKINNIKKILNEKIFLSQKFFKNYINFGIKFTKKVSLSIIIIGTFLFSFGYYQNNISPAKMPEYTISNGEKTVVFQAMSHIGTKEFYENVKNNLKKYKENYYVYFFEGVKSGTKENAEKFNQAIGIKFDKNLYKNFSKVYGVTNQDNSLFLGLVNNLDFNVDLNIDEIMKLYEKNLKIKPITKPLSGILSPSQEKEEQDKKEKKEILDINSELINTLAKLNEKELKILRFINKSILNFLIKSEKSQKIIMDNFSNKKLMDVILTERNKVISKEIINSKYNKIYITYGLLHFKGTLKLLKQKDPNWKIIKTKYLIPIK